MVSTRGLSRSMGRKAAQHPSPTLGDDSYLSCKFISVVRTLPAAGEGWGMSKVRRDLEINRSRRCCNHSITKSD